MRSSVSSPSFESCCLDVFVAVNVVYTYMYLPGLCLKCCSVLSSCLSYPLQAVTDAIGSSVAAASTPHVQQAWRNSFENMFLPGVERSFKVMLDQLNTSLGKCTQEYVHQVQAIVQTCRQSDDAAAAKNVQALSTLAGKCDAMVTQHTQAMKSLSGLPVDVRNMTKSAIAEGLQSFSQG